MAVYVDNHARAEDLAFMADTGETPDGAAHRLGTTRKSLEKWCKRNGHLDLFHALQHNERGAA